MSTIINSFLSSLREIMSQLNPHVIKAFPEDQAATIWTEGGEWPAYHERYESYVPGDVVRNLDALSYASANSIDNALAAVSNGFNNHRETAVSMDCGLGKSTLLVRELHSCKYGRRTIVVEPSSLVAASIAKYIDRHDVSSVLLDDQLNSTRGIYYMSAGVFLHMYLTNNIHRSDLIILDEAHTCTFVYSVTREILTRAHNRLVLMTASTTNRVKALPNVVVYDIKRDRKLNPLTQVASHGEHLIVGVYDDSSYATPANCMVGATIPGLMSVFDTGLRPDPRVDNDQLLPGERIATISEVIQMLGRIGRTDKRGSVYYDSSPAAMRDQPGVALYDILQKAILVYLKLTPGDREFAMRLWKTSGLSADQTSCNDIKTSPDPIDSGFSSSPPMANESSCSTFVKHEDSSHVELPSSLTAVANARPFMRANIEHVTPIKVNDASLQRYWANVITSMNHGDSVFPEPLRIDASSQVDVISQDECRLVVSGRILPDFSEREMLGVISVWNKYVRSLRGRPADNNRLSMFIKYFAEAYAFDVTRF